jgi:hypothetical protein
MVHVCVGSRCDVCTDVCFCLDGWLMLLCAACCRQLPKKSGQQHRGGAGWSMPLQGWLLQRWSRLWPAAYLQGYDEFSCNNLICSCIERVAGHNAAGSEQLLRALLIRTSASYLRYSHRHFAGSKCLLCCNMSTGRAENNKNCELL